jgi:uncharacterized protein (TIGR02646 family)
MKRIYKDYPPIKFESWKYKFACTLSLTATHNGIKLWTKLKKKRSVFRLIRDSILEEQKNLCAYCNREIHVNSSILDDRYTTIDHLIPKSNDPLVFTFDYYNLVASCDGARRDPKPRDLHCDANKKDHSISISPLEKDCEQKVYYTSSGEIFGIDSAITYCLHDTLGLNCTKLVHERKAKILGFILQDPTDEFSDFIDIQDAKLLLKKLPFDEIEYGSAIQSVLKRDILNLA